ncbi:MAG: diguanylate cyclase [Desulfobacteraceae bacterium]|nr:MAG: diguanylate cyclase [Desulfobacteraceae bacterium]
MTDSNHEYQLPEWSNGFESDYRKETGAPFSDGLTGLFNHGFFQIYLEREIMRYQRYGTGFALALIDIDSFFFYNHRHGPLKGDRTLKDIAEIIKCNIRKTDLAARFAGDVFAVILTESDTESAFKPLDRIRELAKQMPHPGVTISIGLVGYPRDASGKESIIQRAHGALKEAKVRGKNYLFRFDEKGPLLESGQPVVLVVDDEPRNILLLEALLKTQGYNILKASNGEDGLHMLAKTDVDVVLLDVMMPGINGFETCRRIKANSATRMVPVVLVTALDDMESKIKGIESGADDFITKPVNKIELIARTKSLINVKRLNNNLTSIENVLFSLAITVEAKDVYTQGHIERVANVAVSLGRKMGLSPREIDALRYGGMLHDIGKIGVPEDVLNKPGALDDEEWEKMKSHPDIGYRICSPLKKNLGFALDVIRHHHEKLDGSGYPDGLKGEEIPTVARIMAVADIYDALITDRPYRKGMPKEAAFGILRKEASENKLDPEVVACLSELIDQEAAEDTEKVPSLRPVDTPPAMP